MMMGDDDDDLVGSSFRDFRDNPAILYLCILTVMTISWHHHHHHHQSWHHHHHHHPHLLRTFFTVWLCMYRC